MKHRILEVGSYFVVIVVITLIWIPVIAHRYYYVPNVTITKESINKARRSPSEEILKELTRYRLFMGRHKTYRKYDRQVINIGKKLLQGELSIPGLPVDEINLSTYHTDRYSQGFKNEIGKSIFNKQGVPPNLIAQILLSAHEKTGREDFLEAARDLILDWARFERKVKSPSQRAILWDDDPASQRVFVLVAFWRFYRNASIYEPDVAKRVLELVARTGQHLARPSEYVFRSNHGVMQNLALWHLCLAFPALPRIEQYKEIAFNRMDNQIDAYVNDEGVVTEHSAFYAEAGLQFLSMALRYLELHNIDVPDKWRSKCERLKDYYCHLRRPDGSLPVFGDTIGGKPPLPTAAAQDHGKDELTNCTPSQSSALYTVGGFSIWWNGLDNWPKSDNLAQTVITWSDFPWHVHKHADELSVMLWAGGQTWWTNVGYWPQAHTDRSKAKSWDGSNAPHLVGENKNSVRRTHLLSHGEIESLLSIELERVGPGKYIAGRQVIHLRPNIWIVIDRGFVGANDRSRTIWTTAHNVSVTEGSVGGSYHLAVEDKDTTLTAFILGSDGIKIKLRNGSSEPFAGWEVVYKDQITGFDIYPEILPTTSIVVEQSAGDSWSAAIWTLNKGTATDLRLVESPRMVRWNSAIDWQLNLDTIREGLVIDRKDNKIFARSASNPVLNSELQLTEVPRVPDKYSESYKAYINASKVRGIFGYQYKITLILIVFFIVQEILLFANKFRVKKYYQYVRATVVLGWIVIGFMLQAFGGDLVAWYRLL